MVLEETSILTIIGNYGFPIFVTLWFMFRTEKIINKNSDAIDRLSVVVESLCKSKTFK